MYVFIMHRYQSCHTSRIYNEALIYVTAFAMQALQLTHIRKMTMINTIF